MTTVLTRARLAGRRNLVFMAAAVAFVLVLSPALRVMGQEPAVRMIAVLEHILSDPSQIT